MFQIVKPNQDLFFLNLFLNIVSNIEKSFNYFVLDLYLQVLLTLIYPFQYSLLKFICCNPVKCVNFILDKSLYEERVTQVVNTDIF